jgi:hypothetical protein
VDTLQHLRAIGNIPAAVQRRPEKVLRGASEKAEALEFIQKAGDFTDE